MKKTLIILIISGLISMNLQAQNDSLRQLLMYPEEMPICLGCSEQLEKLMIYPESAKSTDLTGTVIVFFILGKDQTIRNVEIKKGFSQQCEVEVLRALPLLTNWIPGMQSDRFVDVGYTLPIHFKKDQSNYYIDVPVFLEDYSDKDYKRRRLILDQINKTK